MASDKIDQKRKRTSADSHGNPSKKAAVEVQDTALFATSVVEDNSELAPVIGKTLKINKNLAKKKKKKS